MAWLQEIQPRVSKLLCVPQGCRIGERQQHRGEDSQFRPSAKEKPEKEYKLQPEEEPVYTCMTSDFFLEQAVVLTGKCAEDSVYKGNYIDY